MELDLKNLLANNNLSQKQKILILLATGDKSEKPAKDIREVAVANGLSAINKWNISNLLNRLGGLVVKLPGGWSLTDEGQAALRNLGVLRPSPTKALQPTLRKYLTNVPSQEIKEFVEEAIGALKLQLYRSAVVLSWVGAVSMLYELVLAKHLAAFNVEASKRYSKWKNANTIDDLSKMKEFDFLQILHELSIIGKNTKHELEQCLKLRNACGHPNSHKIGEHRVASHLETLVLNVYSKFVI